MLLVFICCGQDNVNKEISELYTHEYYKQELIKNYNQIHKENRFLLVQDLDSLELAIDLMNNLIQKDSGFIPAYQSKYEYLCRIGDKEEALNTLKEIVKIEGSNLSTFFNIALLYEQLQLPDSSQYYLDLSIKNYKKLCEKDNCSDEDRVNLLFQKFYRGDLSEQEALNKLKDITNEYDYAFYASLWKDFNREEFLNSHCQKNIIEPGN